MSSARRGFRGGKASRVAFAVACALGVGRAVAQSETAESAAPADAGVLSEVVVTAEKRTSSEEKTPISMTVLSTEALQTNAVGNLEDLSAIAPSVSFARAGASTVMTVRGISSRDTTETGDPAVSVNIDGFYFQRAIGFGDSLFDLARVEVLRGPQGTLYGRNATGGAINLVTAKPTKEFGGYATAGIGNYDTLYSEGALNLPLSDRVQMRVSYFTRSHDGYRDNAPARDGDDEDAKAARLHLMAEPTDEFTVLLTAEMTKLGGNGPAVYGTPLITDANGNIDHNRQPLPDKAQGWPLNLPSGYYDATIKAFRWKLDYDLGFGDVTYLGGFRRLDYHNLYDLDGVANEAFYFQTNEQPRTWNHEVRLSSKPGERLTWQVGAFYFQETNDLLSFFQDYNAGTATSPANLFIFTYPNIDATSKAGFGQGSFGITDDLKVEAGVRYTKDYKRRTGNLNYGSGVQLQDASSESSKTTYHVGLDWQATPTSLLYAKLDTGYKAGGFTDAAAYAPESIKAYEVGSKNRLFGNTVQLNLSGFYYDYTNQQISQFIDGLTYIRNAGKSQVYGLELEGTALLTEQDRVDGYIGYLHAKFTDFQLAAGSINVQLAGNRPPQAPRMSLNLGYQHRFPLPNGGDLTPRLQTHYESTTYLTVYNYPDDRQGAFTRTDAMLTYHAPDDKWSVEAYGRNLGNKAVLINAQENGLWSTYNYQFAAPRTYGLQVSLHW
jgi:iron complex outermembrane recepter protein